MKKELLMASALVSTLGAASVAEAVTATMSGHHMAGFQGSSIGDSSVNDTTAVTNTSSFSVSLTETTDGGVTIGSSFMLANEGVNSGLNTAGLALTFTDGTSLDVINAGDASGTHDIAVPSGAGEFASFGTSTNRASTSLDFMKKDTGLGFEWHSDDDFMADGLKVSASYSFDNGAAADASITLESSWGLGATYVTDAGDTAVTIGMGLADSEYKNTGTQASAYANGFHVGFSAVTGDLTVAAGYADGDSIFNGTTDANDGETTMTVSKLGISYVTGDITMKVGYANGEGNDSNTLGTAGTTSDSIDETSASLTYAVASGVTATLGWKDVDATDEGSSDTSSSGTSWYLGATMSF